MPIQISSAPNSPGGTGRDDIKRHIRRTVGRLAAEEEFHTRACLIGPLRRFWALGEERIILASALMADLRKRTNAQRLVLSTCKAGALPAELRPHTLMSIAMYH